MTSGGFQVAGFGTTIFTEMSALAERTGAINLGQGFPDEDGPAEVLEAAVRAMRDGHNQYAPLPGRPGAARGDRRPPARASTGSRSTRTTEVQVTFGATEAIAAALLGLCEPGDEVVCFEPYYDSYAAGIAMAGAVAAPGHAAPAGLARSTRTRWRPRSRRGDARAAAQLAAQPDRQGVLARRAGAGRRGLPSSTT